MSQFQSPQFGAFCDWNLPAGFDRSPREMNEDAREVVGSWEWKSVTQLDPLPGSRTCVAVVSAAPEDETWSWHGRGDAQTGVSHMWDNVCSKFKGCPGLHWPIGLQVPAFKCHFFRPRLICSTTGFLALLLKQVDWRRVVLGHPPPYSPASFLRPSLRWCLGSQGLYPKG